MSTRVLTPQQLVDEFKKSGEFDRLRRELFARFAESVRPWLHPIPSFFFYSDGIAQAEKEALMAEVKRIAKTTLEQDKGLAVRSTDDILKDILQELDRYPLVDRALDRDAHLNDPAFTENLSKSLKETLEAASKD